MARLVDSPEVTESFTQNTGESFSEYVARTGRKLTQMQEASDRLPPGECVGGLISFSVADGKAFYLVNKAAPLELVHIPYLDAYSVHPAMVKGMDIGDVLAQLAQERAWNRLFAKKEPMSL